MLRRSMEALDLSLFQDRFNFQCQTRNFIHQTIKLTFYWREDKNQLIRKIECFLKICSFLRIDKTTMED